MSKKGKQESLQNYRSPDEMKQQVYQQQGDRLFQRLQFQEAVTSYTKALDFQESAELYMCRSKCYVRLGKVQEAIQDAEHALRQAAHSGVEPAQFSFQIAEANFTAGEFEIALRYYHRAYRARSDFQPYKLAVQRAEKAIQSALKEELFIKSSNEDAVNNPMVDDMIQALSRVQPNDLGATAVSMPKMGKFISLNDNTTSSGTVVSGKMSQLLSGAENVQQLNSNSVSQNCLTNDPESQQQSGKPSQQSEIQASQQSQHIHQSPQNAIRCLCGCIGCNPAACRDLYKQPDGACRCRCSACVYHLAYKHALVADPITGQLVAAEQFGNQTLENSSSTNVCHQQQKLSQKELFELQKKNNLKQKSAIQRDRELVLELLNDQTLKRTCAAVGKTILDGASFLKSREQFWENQGLDTQTGGRKVVVQKQGGGQKSGIPKRPRSAVNAATQRHLQAVDIKERIGGVIQQMQKCKTLLDKQSFGSAENELKQVEQLIQQISNIEMSDQNTVNLLTKIQSDLYVMLGCCYFDQNQYKNAVNAFNLSYKFSQIDSLLQIRALRNKVRTLLMVCKYEDAEEILRQLMTEYKLQYNSKLIYASDSYLLALTLSNIDHDKYEKEINKYIQECLQILTGHDSAKLNLSSTKLIINSNEQTKFTEIAPSFFQADYLTSYNLFYDVLIMQAKLFGLDHWKEAEQCYKIIQNIGNQRNDEMAIQSAIASLKSLYNALQEEGHNITIESRYIDNSQLCSKTNVLMD